MAPFSSLMYFLFSSLPIWNKNDVASNTNDHTLLCNTCSSAKTDVEYWNTPATSRSVTSVNFVKLSPFGKCNLLKFKFAKFSNCGVKPMPCWSLVAFGLFHHCSADDDELFRGVRSTRQTLFATITSQSVRWWKLSLIH